MNSRGSAQSDSPLQRFTAVYEALERDRRWWRDSGRLRYGAMGAILCDGDAATVARNIRSMDKALRDESPWHWSLNPSVQFIVSGLLVQRGESPKRFLKAVARVRNLFRQARLPRNLQLELLAVLILRIQTDGRAVTGSTVRRLKQIYDEMKHHHRWITGVDDLPACAILTGQPGSPHRIGTDIEDLYQAMRSHKFAAGNPLQTAANIMYLADGNAAAVAKRAADLKQGFGDKKVKTTQRDYAELAILSLLDLPTGRVVSRVLSIMEALGDIRPKINRAMRFDFAVGIAFLDLLPPSRSAAHAQATSKALTTAPAVLAAHQALLAAAAAAAVMAAVAASSAATAAAASH